MGLLLPRFVRMIAPLQARLRSGNRVLSHFRTPSFMEYPHGCRTTTVPPSPL